MWTSEQHNSDLISSTPLNPQILYRNGNAVSSTTTTCRQSNPSRPMCSSWVTHTLVFQKLWERCRCHMIACEFKISLFLRSHSLDLVFCATVCGRWSLKLAERLCLSFFAMIGQVSCKHAYVPHAFDVLNWASCTNLIISSCSHCQSPWVCPGCAVLPHVHAFDIWGKHSERNGRRMALTCFKIWSLRMSLVHHPWPMDGPMTEHFCIRVDRAKQNLWQVLLLQSCSHV